MATMAPGEHLNTDRSILITLRVRKSAEFPGVTFVSMRRYGPVEGSVLVEVEVGTPASAIATLTQWLAELPSATTD